jgi:predicted transcriptional regulator
LDRILKWAASTSELTFDKAKAWLMSEYNVKENTSGSYLRVVITLGALETQREGKLVLTSLGRRILETEGKDKAKIVVERFMRNYLAFPEVLGVYAQADGPVHLKEMVEALQPAFPRWTSDAQFEYRALWLLSLDCLRQVRGRHYEITELGRTIAAQFPAMVEISVPSPSQPEAEQPGPVEPAPMADEATRLIAELEKAATDSQSHEHLERAVAEAFEFLGFSVDQLGESGDTDVLVQANIGAESYVVIVDAKSRKDGKLQILDAYTLQEHLRNNEADYAVVVAGSFAGGKVVRQAKDNDVVLLSVPMLSVWLRLHSRTPLNLDEYRVMFATSGLLDDLPAALISAAEKREQWAHLLVDLIELIQETYEHGLSQTLPSDQLFAMLVTRLRGVRYPKQQVREAIALLSHPAIEAALGDDETGISLAMSRGTLVRALRALADQIETAEAETEV